MSGMGGWYGEDEDPCYSMFVSQDQIWNLNPILKVLADEGSILAKELGYDMNSYVSDNGYTIYNPYLSWINHYYHYCPTFNEDKLKPWDRVEDRKNKFKMTDKVKRGANNWYYSGGTISCVDNFLGKEYRKNLRTFIYRGIVFFLDRIWHTPLFEKMGVKMKYNAYYCYAATSGIWYDKGFKERLAKRFDIRLAPNPAATIEQEALDVAGVTLEQVQSYQPMEEGYRQLIGILSKYVNKFDKRDKMYLVGYNNAGFDNNFLRALFQQCGDKYFGSWFYPNCMDVYVMVTPFLMGVRNDMENFKLMTVARTMGIEIDENKLHDATYDIELTRDIFYRIIGKMDIKL